jgi:hypothetical protein
VLCFEDGFEEEHGVEVGLEEVHGVEVVFEGEQGVEVVLALLHLVVDDDLVHGLVEKVVHGLVEKVVHGLLDVVEIDLQPAEHEVLVQIVAGVQVQVKVLQLVVTTGLLAVVIL